MSWKEAAEAINELKTSKPIFILQLTRDWDGKDTLTGERAQRVAQVRNPNNVFSDLAAKFFEESWDNQSKRFVVDVANVQKKMHAFVVDTIQAFLRDFSDTKNYSESRQGKWYDRYALQNTQYLDNYYSITKYLLINGINGKSDPESVHVKNVKGILQLIFERDYKDEHLASGRKRRRRRR